MQRAFNFGYWAYEITRFFLLKHAIEAPLTPSPAEIKTYRLLTRMLIEYQQDAGIRVIDV
jgi:hypothetical protein